jgi:hypothetical protein
MMSLEESHFGKRVTGPVFDIPAASRMLTLAEDTEARRKGFTVEEVRKGFARILKVPEKTLLHVRNQRRKSIPSFLMNGIRDVLIGVLQSEIAKLEHEIAIAQQVGLDHREDALEQAAASIAAARSMLERAAEGR